MFMLMKILLTRLAVVKMFENISFVPNVAFAISLKLVSLPS